MSVIGPLKKLASYLWLVLKHLKYVSSLDVLESKQLIVNFPLHKGFHLFPKIVGKHCIL